MISGLKGKEAMNVCKSSEYLLKLLILRCTRIRESSSLVKITSSLLRSAYSHLFTLLVISLKTWSHNSFGWSLGSAA